MLPKAFLFLVPVMDAISLYPDSFHWTSQCSHSPATGNYRQLKFTVAPFYKKLPLTELELLGNQCLMTDTHGIAKTEHFVNTNETLKNM